MNQRCVIGFQQSVTESQSPLHNRSHSRGNIILYYKLSSTHPFCYGFEKQQASPACLPACKVLAPSEILFMAFFSQARHLFPNTDGPCKAGVGGIRIRCRWNCSSRLKASAAYEKKKRRRNVFKHSNHILISVFKDYSAQAAHSFIPFRKLSGSGVPTWPC